MGTKTMKSPSGEVFTIVKRQPKGDPNGQPSFFLKQKRPETEIESL